MAARVVRHDARRSDGGLRWEGVDLNAGTVTVAQGRVQSTSKGGEIYVGDPKSAQRVRAVHMEAVHPGTVDLLRALKARQTRHPLKAGAAWRFADYVDVDPLGRLVRPECRSDWPVRRAARRAFPRSASTQRGMRWPTSFTWAVSRPRTRRSCEATA